LFTTSEVKKVGMRTVQLVTPDDGLVSIPHLKLWSEPIHNANNGAPTLQCVADFYLHPDHDAVQVYQTLWDLALTSPFLQLDQPVAVVAQERPWAPSTASGLSDPPAPAVPIRHRSHRARQGRSPGYRGPPQRRPGRGRRGRLGSRKTP